MKNNAFYQEANNMRRGWGDYLKKIDALKEKFDNREKLALNEACWILWAENGICSSNFLKSKKFIQSAKLGKKKFIWPIWYDIYNGFMATIADGAT